MVRFLGYTGLRAGELAGLNVEDVKLWNGRGYVDVHRTRRKVRAGWQEDTPKSEKSTRQVRLPAWLAEELADYLTTHPGTPDAPLFPNRRNGGNVHGLLNWEEPIEPATFYRNLFRPAVRRAGLRSVRLHDLRHSFAAIMLAAGASIYELSEQMGHSGYRITLDVYAHLIPREDETHPLDAAPAALPARHLRSLS